MSVRHYGSQGISAISPSILHPAIERCNGSVKQVPRMDKIRDCSTQLGEELYFRLIFS